MKKILALLEPYWTYFLLAGIALAVGFFMNKCSGNQGNQGNQDSVIAVAQNQIQNIEANVAQLDNQNIVLHKSNDSLYGINKALDKQLHATKIKYSEIALKYEIERNRVKELPDDSAAGLFLDRADLSEFPVMVYDSNYLIPIEPIRFYNIMAVDLDETREVNANLRNENIIQGIQIRNFNEIIDNKDSEIKNLNGVIQLKNAVNDEKDKQILAEKKKCKIQKRKTILVGTAGAVLVVGALLL